MRKDHPERCICSYSLKPSGTKWHCSAFKLPQCVWTELLQPKHQPSVTTDPRRNRNKLAKKKPFCGKRSSLLRLQSTSLCTTPNLPGSFPGCISAECMAAAGRVPTVPFHLCGSTGCPLQSCSSWMPADRKTPFPSYSCLPSIAAVVYPRLRLLSPPFFPDFTLSFPGLSRKTLLYIKYPLICTLTSREELVRRSIWKFPGCWTAPFTNIFTASSIWHFYARNSFPTYFKLWGIYNSLHFVYDSDVKRQQQMDFKCLNDNTL